MGRDGQVRGRAGSTWLVLATFPREREWRQCPVHGVYSPFASPEATPRDDLCGIEQQPAHVALSSDPSPKAGQVSSVSPQMGLWVNCVL